jgi:hypothetical protein
MINLRTTASNAIRMTERTCTTLSRRSATTSRERLRRSAVRAEQQLYRDPGRASYALRDVAKPGPITCEAKVTQLGKSIAFVEGRLTADDGTLLATASASTRLVEAAKAIR